MLRTLAPLFAPQVIAFTLVFGGVQAAEAGVLGESWRPGGGGAAVVWGGEAHSTPESLAAWLADHGRTYETWAKRHPQAAVELERTAIALGRSAGGDSLLPVSTSMLVLLILVLASVSLLGLLGLPAAVGSMAGRGRTPRVTGPQRLRLAFWPAGIASAVLLGLLAARLVP
jgi:hypothetical protein